MSAFTSDFDRGRAGYSPGHVDALVWALTELMVEPVAGGGLIEWTRLEAERLNAPRNDLNDTTGFVRMQAPANCSYAAHVRTRNAGLAGRHTFHVTGCKALLGIGWKRVEPDMVVIR